jgi:hypothetical protein
MAFSAPIAFRAGRAASRPDGLAEAGDDMARSRHLAAEEVSAMRQDRGHAGVDVAVAQRAVTDAQARHIGDRVLRARRQGAAGQAEIGDCPCHVIRRPPVPVG